MTDRSTDLVTADDRVAAGPLEIPAGRSWMDKHGRALWIALARIALLVVVLVAWQIAAGRWVDPLFISRPSDIWAQLRDWFADGTLGTNTALTVEEIALGFALGASAGLIGGFVLAILRVLGDVLDPYMIALYSIPKVALAPLFIIWFGIDVKMKVLLSAATVFFLVYLNTAAGVRSVDRGLIDAVRLMGGTRRQVIMKVLVPGAMPGVITGLRIGVPYALIGAVVGELVASNKGLGYLMLDSASQFNTAGVFAALAVITVIAGILNFGVNLLQRRSTRWQAVAGE
ncbi:ABC transporter permease [Kribbella sp. NPDC050241]|uniref:ABC transporter permease n=1 Tax=Kribbella sp. NPDC050241 TaxID=3364115 RepID=UPI0037A8E154